MRTDAAPNTRGSGADSRRLRALFAGAALLGAVAVLLLQDVLPGRVRALVGIPVSYTHLTLPTKRIV